MKAELKKEGSNLMRVENIDIQKLVNLLSHVFQKWDTCDIIIDTANNDIYIEPPENIDEEDEFHRTIESQDLPLLDDVKITKELFDLLKAKL